MKQRVNYDTSVGRTVNSLDFDEAAVLSHVVAGHDPEPSVQLLRHARRVQRVHGPTVRLQAVLGRVLDPLATCAGACKAIHSTLRMNGHITQWGD